ncbi:MAG: hypothetical protein R2745_23300 [Vicinamibacterales bacterium]
MSLTSVRTRRLAAFALAVALAFAVPALGRLHAQGAGDPPLLDGAWIVQIQVRDCASQAPLGPPFNSLVTFHAGGTLSESTASAAFAPGQRGEGTGLWTRLGSRTYLQRMAALILFTTPANPPFSPGFEAGGSTVTHTITMQDGSHFTSAGTNAFYRTGQSTPYRTGCSTAVGVRF